MSSTLRSTLRRKVVALLAAPMLLATATAAAPVGAAADQITYKETFYSSATYSTVVGYGFWYCDGDFIQVSGYQTEYSKIKFIAACN
jgi:hypothetical protein